MQQDRVARTNRDRVDEGGKGEERNEEPGSASAGAKEDAEPKA